MTDQAQVDWTLSYLQRHASDAKRLTADAYQPSLYDALGLAEDDRDNQEGQP
jgi:hypothetical protein